MSTLHAFFNELVVPVNVVRSVVARAVTECPRLKARLKKTTWLTSLSGLLEYRAKVGYDGERYHSYVISRRCSPDNDAPAGRFCDCGKFTTFAEASRVANQKAARLATLKDLFSDAP